MSTWCCRLKGNRITIASFKHAGKYLGLLQLTNLVSLDLSANPLVLCVPAHRTVLFSALKPLTRLASLGLAGTWDDVNKPLTRDQRCTYIRCLPTLTNPMSPLRCVPPASSSVCCSLALRSLLCAQCPVDVAHESA